MTQRIATVFVTATALLLTFGSAPATAALPAALDGEPLPSLAPLVRDAAPAVVNIQVTATVTQRNRFMDDPLRRRFFNFPEVPGQRQVAGQGSGVIVDAENGYIITNHHVVENADEIQVTLQDDRQLEATVIGSDAGTDIAVLKVDGDNLIALDFGDSDRLEVGDFVIAIGNPFGLSHTVTSGIVSALGRMGIGGGRDRYEDFIQTDASINPGNSGGALVNLRGELVGINSAILSRTGGNIGIGFAIPSNITQSIMRQLVDFGEVRRGLLGVSINTVDSDNAEALGLKNVGGAIIMTINPDSAAEKAGLQVGDVITAVNGKKVDSSVELSNAIGLLAAGETAEITLLRDGKARTIDVELGDRSALSARSGADIHPGLEGASFASATANSGGSGVEITDVEAGSLADRYQLMAGDIIIQANRQPVGSLADLSRIAEDAPVLWLRIRRGDSIILRQVR